MKNIVVMIFLISCLSLVPAQASVEGTDSGLVTWYTFNDATGTSAADSSGNNYNGILIGSPLPSWTTGKLQGALNFTHGGSVNTPFTISTAPLSECAWIFPTFASTGFNFIMYTGGFEFSTAGFSNNLYLYNDVNAAGTASGSIALGAWQHVCVTMDSGNNVSFYINGTIATVNGTSATSANIGPIPGAGTVTIGNNASGNSPFNGIIDDARIYNRVLSASEVNTIYQEAANGGPSTQYILSVSNAGNGTVTSSPAGISCPSICSASYTVGTPVILTAIPVSGYLTTWSGCGSTISGNTCDVGISANATVTANFIAIPPAPVISNITVSSITSSQATISWTTDQNADSQVNYGTSTSYGQSSPLNTSLVSAHSVMLTNLQPNTTYHFNVASHNQYGVLGTSSDATFTTLIYGPIAPSYVSAKGVAPDVISIVWYIPSDSAGTVTSYTIYRDGIVLATVPAQTFNPQQISTGQARYEDTGLSPNITHTYYITAQDSVGLTSPPSVTVSATTENATTTLIPSERLINWTPGVSVGVPGGIPTMPSGSGIIRDVTKSPYNADNTDTNDASTSIQAAMNAAQPGDVIYLPAGTYRMLNGIAWFGNGMKSHVVLRGAGMNSTILDFWGDNNTNVGMNIGTNTLDGSQTYAITNGLNKSSTTITLTDASPFSIGALAQIITTDDPSLPIIEPVGFQNVRTQMTRITGQNGNVLTISPGLYGDYSNGPASIKIAASQANLVGIEDLTLDGTNTNGHMTNGILITQANGAWIKDVQVKGVNNYNVTFYEDLACEMRHSILVGASNGGNNHSGLLTGATDGSLFEDNIITESFPNMEINGGSSGNVFGYNYLSNSNGLMNIDTNHNPHNDFNLYEGNYINNYVEADGYFGSVSNDIFFRNWLNTIALKRFTRNYSLLGNIVGSCNLGEPNIGNDYAAGFAQPSQGLYWQDWNSTIGPTILGTLTSVSFSTATIQLTNSADAQRFIGYYTTSYGIPPTLSTGPYQFGIDWGQGRDPSKVVVVFDPIAFDPSTNILTFSYSSTPNLPSVGTTVGLWPGQTGFQELDMDVGLTLITKDNYMGTTGIPPDEVLQNGQTLPASLYQPSQPAWFGSLAWPAFDPTNPSPSPDVIPAGYRYDHNGQDPPSATALPYGDVTGTDLLNNGIPAVTMADAELTAQAAVGSKTLTPTQQQAAEVDNTSKLNIYDAYLIAEYATNLIANFPVQNNSTP